MSLLPKFGCLALLVTKPQASQSTKQEPSTHRVNYLLLARLKDVSDPTITRLITAPADFSLPKLDQILRVAFGWAHNRHLSTFEMFAKTDVDKNRFCRRPTLELMDDEGYSNAVRMEGHLGTMMAGLMSDRPARSLKKMGNLTIRDVFEDDGHRGEVLVWQYDSGDGWDHEVHLMGVEDVSLRTTLGVPQDSVVACLSGKGHPCAEDVGGTGRWAELKRMFANPARPDPENQKRWYKVDCVNGDPKGPNPYVWDMAKVNAELRKMKQCGRA